jgi:hypothetical protein
VSEISIHIHEDDWGMRSLHPVAAFFDVRADVARAGEAAARNAAPDGHGWTDIQIVGAPRVRYADAGLALVAVDAALAAVMPRVRRFAATATAGFHGEDPLGAYETDAHAFGFDSSCFIKLEPDGPLVGSIWFEARTADAAHLAALERAFVAIEALAESVVADYWLDSVGRLRDPAFLDRYLAALRANA